MNNEMQHWAAMGENKLLLIVGKYPCKVKKISGTGKIYRFVKKEVVAIKKFIFNGKCYYVLL